MVKRLSNLFLPRNAFIQCLIKETKASSKDNSESEFCFCESTYLFFKVDLNCPNQFESDYLFFLDPMTCSSGQWGEGEQKELWI